MAHPAKKHLDEPTKMAELTFGQWGCLLLGVGMAMGWGMYVSPFSPIVSLFTAIYIAGLPAIAAIIAALTGFDLITLIRRAWRWWRAEGHFLPGAGDDFSGYYVEDDEPPEGPASAGVPALDLESLWES